MIGLALRIAGWVWTLLLAVVTLLAAYGGTIPPDIWALPSVLTLAYPYLALLLLLTGIVWLCMRRFIPAIICGVALLAGGPALSSNLPVATQKDAGQGEKEFSLLSFNIMRGHDARKKDLGRNRTFEYILHSGADIVCVQELVEFSSEWVPDLTKQLQDSIRRRYPYIVQDPDADLAIFSRFPAKLVKSESASSWMKVYDLYELQVYGRRLSIINVHLASYMLTGKERKVVTDIHGVRSARNSVREFKGSIIGKLKESFRARAKDAKVVRNAVNSVTGPLIVCGDFNDVPSSWAYRVICGKDLHDAYRETGLGMMVTYNLHGFYFHIDQVLYRGPLRALSVEKGDIDSSDHFPLLARFSFTSGAE